MADPNHLAALFGDLGIQPTKHVLEIVYPDCEILPQDTEPLLTPPVGLRNRQAPPHDQTRAGVYQSKCLIHIPVEERANASFPEDELLPQFTAFENMARGYSASYLGAVHFYDKELLGEYIRLELEIYIKKENRIRHYDFDIELADWQKIVLEDQSPWVKALDELMTRRTDRAYYHVRNRLTFDRGEEAAVAEEAKWSAGWGGTQLREQERKATTVGDIDKLFEGVEL